MNDRRLRELEQRLRATGAPEDEAAYLHARRQQSDFEVNLRVAACLGYEPARQVVGLKALRLKRGSEAEVQIMGRISLAGARLALFSETSPLPFAQRALAMAELQLVSPCEDREFELSDLAFQLEGGQISRGAEAVLLSVHHLLNLAQRPSLIEVCHLGAWCESGGLLGILGWLLERTRALEAIRKELVPWLLEYSDPLEERVLARRGSLPYPGANPPPRIPASVIPCA